MMHFLAFLATNDEEDVKEQTLNRNKVQNDR